MPMRSSLATSWMRMSSISCTYQGRQRYRSLSCHPAAGDPVFPAAGWLSLLSFIVARYEEGGAAYDGYKIEKNNWTKNLPAVAVA